jgi:hypothetical protein
VLPCTFAQLPVLLWLCFTPTPTREAKPPKQLCLLNPHRTRTIRQATQQKSNATQPDQPTVTPPLHYTVLSSRSEKNTVDPSRKFHKVTAHGRAPHHIYPPTHEPSHTHGCCSSGHLGRHAGGKAASQAASRGRRWRRRRRRRRRRMGEVAALRQLVGQVQELWDLYGAVQAHGPIPRQAHP